MEAAILSPSTFIGFSGNLIAAIIGVMATQYFWYRKRDVEQPRLEVHTAGVVGNDKMSLIIKNDGYSDAEDVVIRFPNSSDKTLPYLKKNAQSEELVFEDIPFEEIYEIGGKLVICYKTVWKKKVVHCWSITPKGGNGADNRFPTLGPKIKNCHTIEI